MYQYFKFDKWFLRKKNIQNKEVDDFFVNERQIWWVTSGYNIGSENYGKGDDFKRPFLVLARKGNMFIGVFTTTKGKDYIEYYYLIPEGYMDEVTYVMKTQIRSIDKKRFLEKMCILSEEDFDSIKNELKEYIF